MSAQTTASPNRNPNGTVITGGQLHAGHIGLAIRFMAVDEFTGIVTVTDAELRQVYHTSADTVIDIGYQAAAQHRLAHDTPVTIDPVPPLTYVFGEPPTVRAK